MQRGQPLGSLPDGHDAARGAKFGAEAARRPIQPGLPGFPLPFGQGVILGAVAEQVRLGVFGDGGDGGGRVGRDALGPFGQRNAVLAAAPAAADI